jgi:hypothetical protein
VSADTRHQSEFSSMKASKTTVLFMNEYEIDEAARCCMHDPVLSKATRFLQEFKNEVNAHSDGWAYWKPAMASAGKLMTLIRSARRNPEWVEAGERTQEKMFLKALTPIRSFTTRRGFAAGMRMPLVQCEDI